MKTATSISIGLLIGLLCSVLALSGCTGTTKSGTKYTQLPNRGLSAVLPGDLATVHNHAADVLKDQFHYTITKDKKDALEGVVEAKTAKDQVVKVETYKEGDHTTKVVVYAGFFESADKGEQILSAIEASLPAADSK